MTRTEPKVELSWQETPEGNHKAGDFTIVKQDMRHATYPYVLYRNGQSKILFTGTLDECKRAATY